MRTFKTLLFSITILVSWIKQNISIRNMVNFVYNSLSECPNGHPYIIGNVSIVTCIALVMSKNQFLHCGIIGFYNLTGIQNISTLLIYIFIISDISKCRNVLGELTTLFELY